MANLTITLKAQHINVFGPAPSSKWSDNLVWGSVGWGQKVVGAGNIPILLTTLVKFLTWSGNNSCAITMSSSFKDLTKNWTQSNTFTLLYANSDKEEYDGSGYNYVFIDRVTNAGSSVTQTYTSQAVAALTYTSQAAASTTWS